MVHVMLDLETWGTKPGAAIRSIGAVVFDPITGDIGGKFYRNISDESCATWGLTKDAATVAWWAGQSDTAQNALLEKQCHLNDVVADFAKWWARVGGEYVWGHGASFDPTLWEAACNACFEDAPWQFWNIRCCRTVLAMANRKVAHGGGTHHNALDDAEAQAKAIAAAFRTKQFSPR